MLSTRPYRHQQGLTLIEVLVTVVILAFGLMGLAGLQNKLNLGMLESYQRAQALVLLNNMSEQMSANRAAAASYVSANTIGTGDSQPADCSSVTVGAARDVCEWSNALKGAAETKSTTKLGAMTGARGCITQVQAPDTTSGVCKPGIYRITVAWQGVHPTTAPSLSCGQNLYGTDTYRRAISTQVTVGLPTCQ